MTTNGLPLERLASELESSWSAATSSDPERWSTNNRALGQCAITALIVQDVFGGLMLRTKVGDTSHYWNQLPSGEEVDLTRGQFELYVPEGREIRSRHYLMSNPDTRIRYLRLQRTLSERLESQDERTVASSVHVKHS